MSGFPLIEGYAGDETLGVAPGRRLAAGAFLAQAHVLAARLPDGGYALLLCQDRVAFAVGLAALLMRRVTALLPPSHAPHAIAALVDAYGPSVALVDRHGVIDTVPEIVVAPWGPGSERDVWFDPPTIEGNHVALIVHTSGTTGVPQPHPKSWSSLVRGAYGLRERTGFEQGDGIGATVPPQHMWGLEASVMLPLQSGGRLHGATPLLPEEIAATLDELEAPRWLVLTPLHLRGLLATRKRLPVLRGALSATMPLDPRDAGAFEAASGACLTEIYGSTETGVAGTRRPALEEAFTPLAGIVVSDSERGLVFEGGQLDEPATLGDRAAMAADGRFTLRGRDADLVKVGGKRASLSMLESTLLSLPGVQDAAFVIYDPAVPTPRLAAAIVAPGVDREWLLDELRKRIDAVFLPRPLRIVDRLPRNPLGKISADALRELVRSTASTAKPLSPAAFCVSSTHPSLPGHFPGRPIVPAALVLALVATACAERLGVRVTGILRARFRSPMLPDVGVDVVLDAKAPGEVGFVCSDAGKRIADGVLAVELRVEPVG